MYEYFAAIGVIPLFGIGIVGLLFTILAFFLLFRVAGRKAIKASDGTSFSTEDACQAYELVLEKVNLLYQREEGKSDANETFGLSAGFLKLLKEEGFVDAKTLIRNSGDFEKLAGLLNQERN